MWSCSLPHPCAAPGCLARCSLHRLLPRCSWVSSSHTPHTNQSRTSAPAAAIDECCNELGVGDVDVDAQPHKLLLFADGSRPSVPYDAAQAEGGWGEATCCAASTLRHATVLGDCLASVDPATG